MNIKNYIQNLQMALIYDDKLSDMKAEYMRIIFEDMIDVYEEIKRKEEENLARRLQHADLARRLQKKGE